MKISCILFALITVLVIGANTPANETGDELTHIKETASIERRDYLIEVYQEMPDNVYESISLRLGDHVSDLDIAEHYLKYQKYYDRLDPDTVEY